MATNGIQIHEHLSLLPHLGEVQALAKSAASTGFYGMTPDQALMVMMRGMEMGLGPSTSLSMFDVIKGKPALKADGHVALCVRKQEICEYFTCVESTDSEAVYETKRRGAPKPVRFSFTIAEATRAELLKNDTWRKYPKTMLRRRCAAMLARDVYPDLCGGLHSDEEVQSFADEPAQREPVRATVTQAAPVVDVAGDIAQWTKLFAECETVADLSALGLELRKEPEAISKHPPLRKAFADRKRVLEGREPPPNGGGAPKPDVVVATEARGDAYEGEDAATQAVAVASGPTLAEQWDAGTVSRETWRAHLATKDAAQAVANSYAAHEHRFGRDNKKSVFRGVALDRTRALGVDDADASGMFDKAIRARSAKQVAA